MACNLLTRIFQSTQQSPRTDSSHPQLTANVPGNSQMSSNAERLKSFKKFRSAIRKTMMHPPFVTAYITGVRSYIPVSLIEELIQDVPSLARVRHSKQDQVGSGTWLFDFEPGTTPFNAMGLTLGAPHLTIDHQLFRLSLASDSRFENAQVVFTAKSRISSLDENDPAASRHRFELKNKDSKDSKLPGVICYICRDDISAPFSTPCWDCKHSQCYDCVRQHFRTALSDFERFPARCCSIFHPDVAKGILSHAEYSKYRLRFEEWLTNDQGLYCPVPRCSAFIPFRLMKLKDDGDLNCLECQVSICMSCKQTSHIPRLCDETTPQMEMLGVMEKFGYKQCPRCKTMIAKMFGCSHIRCACGAHFCYDCGRRQEVCNSRPCTARDPDNHYDHIEYAGDQLSDIDTPDDTDQTTASEESERQPITRTLSVADQLDILVSGRDARTPERDEMDIEKAHVGDQTAFGSLKEDLSDEPHPIVDATIDGDIIMTGISPVERNTYSSDPLSIDWLTTSATTEPETIIEHEQFSINQSEAPPSNHSNENLDDPNARQWEYQEDYYFGEEPDDEDELDMWGCVHQFTPITQYQVPRYWKTASVPDWWERDASDREIDCMICWQPAKIAPTQQEVDVIEDDEERTKITKDWRYARKCWKCSIIVCRRCRNDLSRNMRQHGNTRVTQGIITDSAGPA